MIHNTPHFKKPKIEQHEPHKITGNEFRCFVRVSCTKWNRGHSGHSLVVVAFIRSGCLIAQVGEVDSSSTYLYVIKFFSHVMCHFRKVSTKWPCISVLTKLVTIRKSCNVIRLRFECFKNQPTIRTQCDVINLRFQTKWIRLHEIHRPEI